METVFRDWKIDKCIGEGAFGKVYRIVREDFGHTYEAALKVIEVPQNQSEIDSIRNDGMTEENVTEYFHGMVEDIVEEFALMSKLKGNSNIVSYEDHSVVKKEDGFGWKIYIRMELLTPLFTHIKQHKMTVRDVTQIGIDICHALEVCQKYNIIHRDIKPENIFVSDIGTYKLGDFGIARQLEKTSSGLSKKGTFTYMAPEVYKGLEYNSTVDIYSLGIVLYRFLNNNRSPFMPPVPEPIRYSDKEKANIMRISGQRMPKPCNATGRLAEIVLKACAYNPSERYESAYSMRQALQETLYSDSERKLIYPEGDTLENKTEEYILDETNRDLKQKLEESDVVEEPKDGTVYLFHKEQQKSGVLDEQINIVKTETLLKDEKIQSTDKPRSVKKEKLFVDSEHVIEEEREDKVQSDSRNQSQSRVEKKQKKREKNAISKESKQNKSILVIKKQKEKKLLVLAIPVVAVAVLVVVILTAVITEKNSKKIIPNLVGMSVEKAEDILEKENIILQIGSEEYSDRVNDGLIISQNLREGEKVEKDTVVEVIVSKGKEEVLEKEETFKVKVPDLVGLSQAEAEGKAEEYKFSLLITEKYSDTVKKGNIIGQSPKKDNEAELGSSITVIISRGVEKVTVPKLTGLSLARAKALLKKSNLKYKTERDYSNYTAKGKVMLQSIKSEKKVKKGTVVVLTISKGKKPVPVVTPDTSSAYNNYQPSQPVVTPKPEPTKKPTPTKKPSNEDYSDWNLVN